LIVINYNFVYLVYKFYNKDINTYMGELKPEVLK